MDALSDKPARSLPDPCFVGGPVILRVRRAQPGNELLHEFLGHVLLQQKAAQSADRLRLGNLRGRRRLKSRSRLCQRPADLRQFPPQIFPVRRRTGQGFRSRRSANAPIARRTGADRTGPRRGNGGPACSRPERGSGCHLAACRSRRGRLRSRAARNSSLNRLGRRLPIPPAVSGGDHLNGRLAKQPENPTAAGFFRVQDDSVLAEIGAHQRDRFRHRGGNEPFNLHGSDSPSQPTRLRSLRPLLNRP